jgi:hypothetical protein
MQLLSTLRELGQLEVRAHEAGLGHPAALGCLALVYGQRPGVLEGLEVLEAGTAAEVWNMLTTYPVTPSAC